MVLQHFSYMPSQCVSSVLSQPNLIDEQLFWQLQCHGCCTLHFVRFIHHLLDRRGNAVRGPPKASSHVREDTPESIDSILPLLHLEVVDEVLDLLDIQSREGGDEVLAIEIDGVW